MLIKELIENHGLVNLITRPRRFGKTFSMNMLQYFLECSAEDTASLFEGLNISEEKELCREHMGAYPIISLTLMNAKRDTFEDAMSSLIYTIAEEFRRHKDVVEQSGEFREQIDRIMAKSKQDINGYYKEMLDFIRAFLNFALKSNPNLEFAVLTGCLKLSQESVFTGLNNFITYSMLDRQLEQYFGFQPEEVLDMLKHYDLVDKQDKMQDCQQPVMRR